MRALQSRKAVCYGNKQHLRHRGPSLSARGILRVPVGTVVPMATLARLYTVLVHSAFPDCPLRASYQGSHMARSFNGASCNDPIVP